LENTAKISRKYLVKSCKISGKYPENLWKNVGKSWEN
jgi:hypothetical protein